MQSCLSSSFLMEVGELIGVYLLSELLNHFLRQAVLCCELMRHRIWVRIGVDYDNKVLVSDQDLHVEAHYLSFARIYLAFVRLTLKQVV